MTMFKCKMCRGGIAFTSGATYAAALKRKFSVGNHVTFGTYPQNEDDGDNTSIEWLVLARDGNKALLLSKYGLDAQSYNAKYEDVTWEKCTLRAWLNTTFLNEAFTAEEQKGIVVTNVPNSNSQGYSDWSTKGANDTQDKVFLLSYAEANRYLDVTNNDDSNNTKAWVAPTVYAIAQGAYTNSAYTTAEGEATGWWWLRSPGYYQNSAASVSGAGSLHYFRVDYANLCVRPAIWVDLSSDAF